MKKITYALIVVSLLLAAVLFTGCAGNKTTYQVEFPKFSEEDGFTIEINGVFEDVNENIYTVAQGENITFSFVASEGFTFKDLVVKKDGVVMMYVDESTSDLARYVFTLTSISQSHKITIASGGAERKKYKLTLNRAKYRESIDDTVGKAYEGYDNSAIKVKYNNTVYASLTQAINDINSRNIEIEHGGKFEIWIGSHYPNYYEEYSFDYLYGYEKDFNGIMGQILDGETMENLWDINASYTVDPEVGDGVRVYENNMYKYVFEKVEHDLNLYVNTIYLRKSIFSIEYENTQVLSFETSLDYESSGASAIAGENFTVYFETKKPEGLENLSFKDMKIYINGYDISDNLQPYTEDENKMYYTVIGIHVPGYYNPEETGRYIITVSGVDLSAYDVTKIKTQASEAREYVNYSTSGEEPLYIEDGYRYYKKSSEWIKTMFYMNNKYNYENMEIKVNDVVFKDYTTTSEGEIQITFSGDYEDEYLIEVSGVVLKQFTYTINNPHASSVDLYLRKDGVETLITVEYTLVLVDGDNFELELRAKTDLQNIVEYKFTGHDVEKEQSGGVDIDESVEWTNLKWVGIIVSAEANPNMRDIIISK